MRQSPYNFETRELWHGAKRRTLLEEEHRCCYNTQQEQTVTNRVFHEDEVMVASNDSGNCPEAVPQLRIRLCGPFQMEWVDPTTGAALSAVDPTVGSRDRAAAISLLALLLCQPNRQAHRDWVMEQFWPEGRRDVAIHRLENIFFCLRKLLRPPSGGESLVHSTIGKKSGGTSYCLEAYPTLWVDTDALTWNVEQAARMERFGDDALPFWERAFALLKRGPFLVDDPYEPYAIWIKEQRERLEGYARQCVHALAHLYLARHGEVGKAEALLLVRTYWQQYKTDQDVLRPLLELLGEQERYQEAEAYYQQYLAALAELGPDEEGQPRVPDARTRDIREYLRTKQIQRERVFTPTLAESQILRVRPVFSAHLQSEKQLLTGTLSVSEFSLDAKSNDGEVLLLISDQIFSPGSGVGMGASIAEIITEVDDWIGHAAFCQKLQPILAQKIRMAALQSRQPNEQEWSSEQESLLTSLAALPQAVLTSFQQKRRSEFQIEAFLPRCAASITAC
jgi:DNA-binding SARP family transcriptional activator